MLRTQTEGGFDNVSSVTITQTCVWVAIVDLFLKLFYFLFFFSLRAGVKVFSYLPLTKGEGWGEGGKIVKSQQIKYFNVFQTG